MNTRGKVDFWDTFTGADIFKIYVFNMFIKNMCYLVKLLKQINNIINNIILFFNYKPVMLLS